LPAENWINHENSHRWPYSWAMNFVNNQSLPVCSRLPILCHRPTKKYRSPNNSYYGCCYTIEYFEVCDHEHQPGLSLPMSSAWNYQLSGFDSSVPSIAF
jgi:hypothetical protein